MLRASIAGRRGVPTALREIAAELVGMKVAVIVTWGTEPVLAAKKATSAIPTVSAIMGDPVGNNIVASLARPGGNITGLSIQGADLAGKRLELLREVVPGFRRLAILLNVGNASSVSEMGEVVAAARSLGIEVATLDIRRAEDIAPAIQALNGRADALYVTGDPLFTTHRVRINTVALGARLPTMHTNRQYVEAAGLMSYGPNFPDPVCHASDPRNGRLQKVCSRASRWMRCSAIIPPSSSRARHSVAVARDQS